MEVVDESACMLSNHELFTLLTDIQAGQHGHRKPSQNQQPLATVSYSTLKYLEKTPCARQSPDIIHQFMTLIAPFSLTKAEKLQLLNHRPTSAVEIQLIVEESEERLTEGQIDKLLEIIADTLPGDDEVPDGNGAEYMDVAE